MNISYSYNLSAPYKYARILIGSHFMKIYDSFIKLSWL